MKNFFENPSNYEIQKNNQNNKYIKIKSLISGQQDLYIDGNNLDKLIKTIDLAIRNAVLNYGLLPKNMLKLAVISGAGIAGLAASLELIRKGYKVVIAEKRNDFNRFNIINLDIDAQHFLNKFGLLAEFEREVAGKIKLHKYVLTTAKGMEQMGPPSDVSNLQANDIPFSPELFNKLFTNDGVYSVKIKELQNFLAKKALDMGAYIYGNVESNISRASLDDKKVKIKIKGQYSEIDLQPDLFLISEGTHSTTADKFGMKYQEIKNNCTGENWIFGNMQYNGSETFVVSVIDISGDRLEIANIIFNAKVHEINIAVTASANINQKSIKERILNTVKKVLELENIHENLELISVVEAPVDIKNEKRVKFSNGNVFCIGDTAGHSSPLAGMGGTLGLTLVPATINKLVEDIENNNPNLHVNFHTYSNAYVDRWINKSVGIKNRCIGMFDANKKFSNPQEQEQIINLQQRS